MDIEKKEEIIENPDHLTIVDVDSSSTKTTEEKKLEDTLTQNDDDSVEEVKKVKKRGFFNWVRRLYGLSNEEEDLDFVYSSYSASNEEPSSRANYVFLLVVGIFISFLLWATFAQIDELARGNGKVIPTDKIQTVQSLDGGIISEISVKEGQTVKKGDSLMKIDTTRFQATLEESLQEYYSLLALKTRLVIESNIEINKPLPKVKFDKKVIEDPSRYDLSEMLFLENKFRELKSSVRVLDTQLNQKIQEQKEIESNIRKLEQSLKFIIEQRKTIKKLVARGIKSKYDLLNIEKEHTQTRGDLETARLSISRSTYAIAEAKHRISERINTFRAEASNELQQTLSQINRFEAKLVGDEDKVARTVITSPVDGIVKQLNLNTIGGVVQSGMELIEIVPLSDALVVEAKIDPKDIAFINPSQKAIIKITAYDFSIYGGLDGKIIEISADSIVDKESKEGKSYYRVLVKTDKNYLERQGIRLPIIPGMVASVDIVTGKKTILDFLLKPILKVKQDSLHER
ncbi:HlyD family type I secretion periplasmic adaptor subunit [Poseidonibacter lekithochrous]|uniref:HlyD family type I secretion periplasmic adaptor subunit n=1 Tax=Poseidonibacter lekithochrous TaxID=1904463 RepID=UPI0009F891E0|nr:HlyD family type I secretion periplasmic adaptor subunit [Poseidonibacter lekithochrous]QKJ24415.1 type I secretion system membrane fusion protein, HlyD family [Poseidonibacter lekithochrous]